MINKISLLTSMAGVMLALFLLREVSLLEDQVTKLESRDPQRVFLDAKPFLDPHIDVRIEDFIKRQKSKRVAGRIAAYTQAADAVGDAHVYGDPKARFTLLHFTDIECPYCKKFHDTPKRVVDNSKGTVNWQLKHFPLPMHDPLATVGAVATECVASLGGNKLFWVYLQELFDSTKGNGMGPGDFSVLADNFGVSTQKMEDCLRSDAPRNVVQRDKELAKLFQIDSTPTTILIDNVTGQKVRLRGMVEETQIVQAITQLATNGNSLSQVTQKENSHE